MLSKTYENMNTFEQNEIDGVEAVDIKFTTEHLIHYDTPIQMFTKGMEIMFGVKKICPTCKGDKVFEKITSEGLQYGYICPQCQGTGVKQ
jgi:hypothetical protein